MLYIFTEILKVYHCQILFAINNTHIIKYFIVNVVPNLYMIYLKAI